MANVRKEVAEAVKELRRVHEIGQRINKAEKGTPATAATAAQYGISRANARKYQRFADSYTATDVKTLAKLCEDHGWPVGFTAIDSLVLFTSREVRKEVEQTAAKEGWAVERIDNERFQRQGRLRTWAGRKRKLPSTPRVMIQQLKAMSIAWERLNVQLRTGSGDSDVRLADLPAAIRKTFAEAAKAVEAMGTAIDHWNQSHP